MNPELTRNLWLEFTRTRLILMPAILGLLFFAADVTSGSVRPMAEAGYWLIVIFWGTWKAARSVVGEIRERTWDGQRLSAISPWTMVWGKLFGATAYVWYGGILCIAALGLTALGQGGGGAALQTLVRLVALGVLAHSVAMLTSLISIRRRYNQRGIDTMIFQIAGIGAAFAGASVWSAATASAAADLPASVDWFMLDFPLPAFLLGSFVVFAVWSLVGNYRLMRTELQVTNGPLVFIGFLLFMMAYVAGLGASGEWLTDIFEGRETDAVITTGDIYLFLAASVASALTYVMMLLDPKDWVLYRWLGASLAGGRPGAAFTRLQGWMIALTAFLLCVLVLALTSQPIDLDRIRVFGEDAQFDLTPFYVAWAAFVLRDVGLVLFFNAREGAARGDMGALIVIVLAYLLPPVILGPIGAEGVLNWFYPEVGGGWGAAMAPIVQALAAWGLMLVRVRAMRSRPLAAPG